MWIISNRDTVAARTTEIERRALLAARLSPSRATTAATSAELPTTTKRLRPTPKEDDNDL